MAVEPLPAALPRRVAAESPISDAAKVSARGAGGEPRIARLWDDEPLLPTANTASPGRKEVRSTATGTVAVVVLLLPTAPVPL